MINRDIAIAGTLLAMYIRKPFDINYSLIEREDIKKALQSIIKNFSKEKDIFNYFDKTYLRRVWGILRTQIYHDYDILSQTIFPISKNIYSIDRNSLILLMSLGNKKLIEEIKNRKLEEIFFYFASTGILYTLLTGNEKLFVNKYGSYFSDVEQFRKLYNEMNILQKIIGIPTLYREIINEFNIRYPQKNNTIKNMVMHKYSRKISYSNKKEISKNMFYALYKRILPFTEKDAKSGLRKLSLRENNYQFFKENFILPISADSPEEFIDKTSNFYINHPDFYIESVPVELWDDLLNMIVAKVENKEKIVQIIVNMLEGSPKYSKDRFLLIAKFSTLVKHIPMDINDIIKNKIKGEEGEIISEMIKMYHYYDITSTDVDEIEL